MSNVKFKLNGSVGKADKFADFHINDLEAFAFPSPEDIATRFADMQWQAYVAAKFAEISQNTSNNNTTLPPAIIPEVTDTPEFVPDVVDTGDGPISSENTLPTDPTQGWHLNAINVKDVWTDYTGDGVLVGIVDDGFAYTHPDLAANYDTSVDYDVRDGDNDAYGAGGHGTKVAGVIGAASNGSGTVGISYGADITGFRIGYGSSGSYSKSVQALDIAGQTADVVNSSWGYSTTFTDNFSKIAYSGGFTALQNGVDNGRDGLGTVYVFSAGNDRGSGQDVNYHSFGNSPFTIAVAGTTSSGTYASWSNPGAALLVAAPGSGIATTTGTGSYGSASGTSFAAPIVSGVVALMLEANPELGYRDVQEILAYSASLNDSNSSAWDYNGAGNWNGGGLHFNHNYGFGMVDALAAVRLAETWTKQSVFDNQYSFSYSSAPNKAIPDANPNGATSTIVVTKDMDIDTVQVNLEIDHTKIGDLVVTLVSPDGTEAVLANRPGGSGNTADDISFSFTANNFWGENPVGAWTLKVEDKATGETGTLENWTLIFNGDASSSDDTYFYTDLYTAFNDSSRQSLQDSSGIDAINAATVTSDVVLNLNGGTISTIAGKPLEISAGTVIENAFMGDGNDTVIGNSANNYIWGGRGDDTLSGGSGTDTAGFINDISAYDIQIVSASTIIVTFSGSEGIDEGRDTLTGFEKFEFNDQTYTFNQLEVLFGGAPVNHAPTVSQAIADKTANEDSGFVFTLPSTTFVDADSGDTLSYTATLSNGSALPSWLSFNATTRTFSGTPDNDDVGQITVRVTATDNSGAKVSDDFKLTINNTNDAPTVSSPVADRSVNEDSAFSYTIPSTAFKDVDAGDSLTYSAKLADGSSLPSWLTFNAATRTFSGTPDNDDVGQITVRVTATDNSGAKATDDFKVTVNNTNDAPVLVTPVSDRTANEDSAFSYTVPSTAFKDVDAGDSLTYSAKLADGSSLPSWLTFNATTRTFSGTPDNDDVGQFTVRITATDNSGAKATDDFKVTVNNTNDAPVLVTPVSDRTANEDSAFSYTVPSTAFKDVDVGDSLSYSAKLADGSALPSWLSFNATTRTFSGTPDNDDVGQIIIRLTATDTSGAKATDDFVLTVDNANNVPTVVQPIADRTISEDASFAYTVPSTAFNDVDAGDVLAYSATLADGSALPSWLTFNATTRTFSGTPDNGDVGQITVRVTATDASGAKATDDFKITINNVNDAPVVSTPIQNKSVNEDSALSYTIPSTAFKDVDAGDSLNYSAKLADGSALPSWLSFNASTRTFSGTPDNGDVGSLNIRVTATDTSGANVSDDFVLTINNTNDAPTLDNPVVDATINEDAAFSYTIPANTFSDMDAGDVLSYSAKLADGSSLPAWLSFNATTGKFSGTPANGDVGQISVRVTATDKSGAKATDDFNITVKNVNDAPVVSKPLADTSVEASDAFSYVVSADAFTDVDAGDALVYSATLADGSALPSWLSFNSTTRAFSGTPSNDDRGQISVRVTATDKSGATATDEFSLTVNHSNDTPVVANPLADKTVSEDALFSYTVPSNTFADSDLGDVLSFSAALSSGAALPSWLSFNTQTGTFSGTPENGDVGQITVRVTATDKSGATVSDDYKITVNNTNDAPTVSQPLSDGSVQASDNFNYTVPANAFTDVDAGDVLTFAATLADGSALPSWLSFNSTTRTFSGTPTNDHEGQITVRVTATDKAGAKTSDDFKISISPINHAPTVEQPIADTSVNEDSALSYTIPSTAFKDVDAGDSLTYSAQLADGSDLPSWLTFNTATGTFSGTPENDDIGQITVRVTATDSEGAKATDDFKITVNNTNDAPTVSQPLANKTVSEFASFLYVLPLAAFADVDAGDSLTYSAQLADGSSLPSWLTFDGATRTFSGEPGASDSGVLSIRVTATDQSGASVSDDFTLTVNDVNARPEVTGNNTSLDQGDKVDAADLFTVVDVDGDHVEKYFLWSGNDDSGHWEVGGIQVANSLIVTAEQFESAKWVAGKAGTTEDLWLQAYDGKEWGDWVQADVTSTGDVNVAPEVEASNINADAGQAIALTDLFDLTDANGDPIEEVFMWTGVGASGHWEVDGQVVKDTVTLTADQFETAVWVAGSVGGTEEIWLKAYDGQDWSEWSSASVNSGGDGNLAPDVVAVDLTVAAGSAISLGDLFSASDSDGDDITQYYLHASDEQSGHWEMDGLVIADSMSITADQFDHVAWVAGEFGSNETVWLRAFDGEDWSNWIDAGITADNGGLDLLGINGAHSPEHNFI